MRKVLYIFGLLTDADVQWMADVGEQRRLTAGDVVIREGEHTESFILLLEGELIASTRSLGEIARMGVGEVVGEMSLIDSAPPSATITANGNGLALFLNKTKLLQQLETDDGFGSRFYRALAVFLADRLRDARRVPGNHAMSDTIIANDELDAGILDRITSAGERFDRMVKALSRSRPVT